MIIVLFIASLNIPTVALLVSAVATGIVAIMFRLTMSLCHSKTKLLTSSAVPCPPPPARSRGTITAATVSRLSARGRCLVVVYVCMWLLRCIFLTLTVGSLTLRVQLEGDIEVVGRSIRQMFRGRLDLDGASVGNEVTTDWDVVGLAENEAKRRGKRWRAMRESCESYVDEMTDIVIDKVLLVLMCLVVLEMAKKSKLEIMPI